jgi:hypothetical protein
LTPALLAPVNRGQAVLKNVYLPAAYNPLNDKELEKHNNFL